MNKITPLMLNDAVNAVVLAMDGKISRYDALLVTLAALAEFGVSVPQDVIDKQRERLPACHE